MESIVRFLTHVFKLHVIRVAEQNWRILAL